jgi:glycosyltransferase involved in cell wall biosynthesis
VYLGQVSEGKGCDELISAWTEMRDAPDAPLGTLVLVGTVRMELPARDDVVALGRVDDAEKFAALAAADALVLPSRFESLGIVLLEAWQAGTPVLVPAHNAVTAGQTRRSGGGVVYDSLPRTLRDVLSDGDGLPGLGARGRDWTIRESSMEAFDARLGELVDLASHAVEGAKSLR